MGLETVAAVDEHGQAPVAEQGGAEHHVDHHRIHLIIMIMATGCMVAGFGLAYLMYIVGFPDPQKLAQRFPRVYRAMVNKFYMDELYRATFVGAVLGLAKAGKWFDLTVLDGIVDVTETGSSLRANKLRVIDTLMLSTPRLIANKAAMQIEWKRKKIENIALLLQGAIAARAKSGLKMNVARENLDAVIGILPSEKSPTISHLADENWVALEVIVEEKTERDLIPLLREAGASGIISYPLSKVIP